MGVSWVGLECLGAGVWLRVGEEEVLRLKQKPSAGLSDPVGLVGHRGDTHADSLDLRAGRTSRGGTNTALDLRERCEEARVVSVRLHCTSEYWEAVLNGHITESYQSSHHVIQSSGAPNLSLPSFPHTLTGVRVSESGYRQAWGS